MKYQSPGILSLDSLAAKHNKLALLLDDQPNPYTLKEDTDGINLNHELSKALLNISLTKRPTKLRNILQDLIGRNPDKGIYLTGLEVLFEPGLKVEVVPLLKLLSHTHIIIAHWPGTKVGKRLTYSQLGHPEYQSYAIGVDDDFDIIESESMEKDDV